MKLHWSPRSPFVRKVMIAAHELGLTDRIRTVRTVVHPHTPNEDLLPDNPLSKLPTLVLDDGSALFDSRVICEYLDGLSDRTRLLPASGPDRIAALRDQALGDGLMDLLLLWLLERAEPDETRSERLIDAYARKREATLARLEGEAPSLAARPFDIGHVTVGTALLYLDFRFPDAGWRHGRPTLAAWHRDFAARPSVVANPAVDD